MATKKKVAAGKEEKPAKPGKKVASTRKQYTVTAASIQEPLTLTPPQGVKVKTRMEVVHAALRKRGGQ